METQRTENEKLRKELKAFKELSKSAKGVDQLRLSQINPLESVALTEEGRLSSVMGSVDFDLTATNRVADSLENMSSPVIHPSKAIPIEDTKVAESEHLTITDEDFTPEIIEEEKNGVANSWVKNSVGSSIIESVTEDTKAEKANHPLIAKAKVKLKMNKLLESIVGSNKLMQSLKEPLFNTKNLSKTQSSVHTNRFSLKFPPPPKTAEITTKQPIKLFEEFFIISAPLDLVDAVKLVDFAYLPPSILYKYPNLPENSDWYYSLHC